MIRFENVTKRYPNQSRPALDGIDLNIERGEFAQTSAMTVTSARNIADPDSVRKVRAM